MKLAIMALTPRGRDLAIRLQESISRKVSTDLFLPTSLVEPSCKENVNTFPQQGGLSTAVRKALASHQGLVMIMAMGIVVRLIAPHIESKESDPAVVTIDQGGRYVISTLSGHLGGANLLAERIASLIGARPVITTATDSQGREAADLLAQRLNSKPEPKELVKEYNAALAAGQRMVLYSDFNLQLQREQEQYPLDQLQKSKVQLPVAVTSRLMEVPALERCLWLRPRSLIMGLGCRRGMDKARIISLIKDVLRRAERSAASLRELATIELKASESGLVAASRELGIPLVTVSKEEIRACPHQYSHSELVNNKIGVGGVCEPAALVRAQEPRLIVKKMKSRGVTAALVEDRSQSSVSAPEIWRI